MTPRPGPTEAADYYFTYIDQVPSGDICAILLTQLAESLAYLKGVSEEQSRRRYASDKWTVKQVLSHISDTERVFAFRALWFARGFTEPLPSFSQDTAIEFAGADERSWGSHVDEFREVRDSTLALFDSMPDAAWDRQGIASGQPVSVRALAFIAAGHVAHHVKILQERYFG
jgi:uncharacterized damage-inducible protein DinB